MVNRNCLPTFKLYLPAGGLMTISGSFSSPMTKILIHGIMTITATVTPTTTMIISMTMMILKTRTKTCSISLSVGHGQNLK
ncbi:MAG: hypothetical protein IPJ07_24675 [Acidobacteria bacterium]|nr:hypothetical protein [Acidobacteriota bacterium]